MNVYIGNDFYIYKYWVSSTEGNKNALIFKIKIVFDKKLDLVFY